MLLYFPLAFISNNIHIYFFSFLSVYITCLFFCGWVFLGISHYHIEQFYYAMAWSSFLHFFFFLVLGLCALIVFIKFGGTSSIFSSDGACVPPFSSEDSTEVCLGLPAVVPQPTVQ